MLARVVALALAGLQGSAGRTAIRWQLMAAALCLAVMGCGFLAYAIDLELALQMTPPAAAAVTAGLLIVLALALVGIATIVGKWPGRGRARKSSNGVADIVELVKLMTAAGEKLDIDLQTSAKPMAIAALIAGCAVGCSPGLQRLLRNFLR